jgi:stearoyl-CoA desaturase (delta-9 desaturase)
MAHRHGSQTWTIEGLAVQGRNVDGAGLITFGEAWHNNHHAWPRSAGLGLFPCQIDLGWWFISLVERAGLARNVQTPEQLLQRDDLRVV